MALLVYFLLREKVQSKCDCKRKKKNVKKKYRSNMSVVCMFTGNINLTGIFL